MDKTSGEASNLRDDIQKVENWVEEYGDALLGAALVHVRNLDIAEDIVQNTFLSALKAKDSFKGNSSIKTWLMSILHHKVIDHFRRKKTFNVNETLELESLLHESFDPQGKWNRERSHWTLTPEQMLEKDNIQETLWKCIDALPERLRTVFVMRDIEGASTDVICKELDISASNFGVLMYRIRHKLRHCFFSHGIQKCK